MPNIEFDRIVEPALVGVNRTLVFLGLGVNAALSPALSDFRLSDASHIDLLPSEVSAETVHGFKREFGIWVVGNGLRELIETWDVFLDRLYVVALQAEHWRVSRDKGEVDAASYKHRAGAFPRRGTAEKLAALQAEFSVSLEFRLEIESLKNARNCLTHRLGIVGTEDVGSEATLVLSWRAPELFGYEVDGSEFVPPLDSFPIDFPRDSPVMHRHGVRSKILSVGERLELFPGELKEVCYTFRIAILQTQESFAKFVARMGGSVTSPDSGTKRPKR